MRIVGQWSKKSTLVGCVLVAAALLALILGGCGGPATTGGGAGTGTTPSGASSGPPTDSPASAKAALPKARPPDVSAYSFTSTGVFKAPAAQYKSKWNTKGRTRKFIVSIKNGGVRATVTGGPDVKKNQYAGVVVPVSSAKALKLDITFDRPEGIRVLFVDGVAAGGAVATPLVRGEWRSTKGKMVPAGRATYVLVPGRPSGYFESVGGSDGSKVRQVNIFAMVDPGKEVDFTVHKVEVGK